MNPMTAISETHKFAERPVVVVAGGTGGIGSAICQRLSNDGFQVVSAARGKTLATAQTISNILQINCDVTMEADCRSLVRQTMERFGRVDSMVYAAIGYYHGTPESHDYTTIKNVFDANVIGALLLSSACYSMAMKKAGKGGICFLGSTAGSLALPNRAAYCASKAALLGLCKALAVDWARFNVRVNCVTTSYVATELEMAGAASGDWGYNIDELCRRIPSGRLARPSEIAAAVAWLISDEAIYLSGSELLVDGAWSAWCGHGKL
jgi:NAD(P)-dependent dehydrogenase (short-subunit alcohol dehydrogenase family)